MRCEQCHWEATAGAKFCAQCGEALAARCAACGQTSPPGAKFCVGCGARQVSLSTAATGAADHAVTAAASPERRLITVMFCDLADSTSLSTRLDPEDYRDLIGAYHAAAAGEIERYGGFVAKFMGDGVLAYFGYPAAHEDDAEHAVRAGLGVVASVESLKGPAGQLRARVGVATGPVIVGDLIGQGSAREQAISGETPNLAARLQGLAEQGSVVIAASTHRLTGKLFHYKDLGAVSLKGFGRPQHAFRVLSANESLGRFEALRSALTPLVGREEELDLLLRRWQRTRTGEPQIVLIAAEPGIGKSRLIAAFRQRIKDDPHEELAAYCAPHALDSAFFPIIRAIEARCGIVSADDGSQRLDKMEVLVGRILGELDPGTCAVLASLLSIPSDDRYPAIDLSPQRMKDETIRVLVQLTLHAATAARPAVTFFEDAHWTDPSSLELLRARVRDQAAGVPVMLVVTYRPEFQPPTEWFGQPDVTSLTLSRLRPVEAEAMVVKIAGARRLPTAVLHQILDHAEGVPLFIEEITRTVLERHSAASAEAGGLDAEGPLPAIAVPTTLQASLLSRLDRLSSGKEIAQIGAAIGREFPHALLAVVADRPAEALDAALLQLVEADLIFPRGGASEPAYVFKHALIQDTAYGAMLRAQRQTLHGRIADALSSHFPDQADARPELLAHHLALAGRSREAVHAWRRAAVKTLRAGSWAEGLGQLQRGLQAIASLAEGNERNRLELDLQMMVGGVTMGAVGHSAPGAIVAYTRAYALAKLQGEHRIAALAGARLWIGYYGAGDLEGVLRSIESVEAEVGPDTDALDRALIRSGMTTPLGFMGRFGDSDRINQETAGLIEQAGRKLAPPEYYYMSPVTQPRNAMLVNSLALGRLRTWAATCQTVEGELKVVGAMGAVICLTMLIYTRYLAADWKAVAEDTRRLRDAVSEIEGATHYLDLARLVEARLAVMSDGSDAGGAIDQILERPSVAFAMQHLPRYLMIAGDAHADAGNADRARICFEEALKGGPFGTQQWLRSELQRRVGDLALLSDPEQALAHYEEALATARDQQALLFELRAAMRLAPLWRDRGRAAEAAELLDAICIRFSEPCVELDEARQMAGELRGSVSRPQRPAGKAQAITT